MTLDAVTFTNLLNRSKVNMLGYSLGRRISQQMTAKHSPRFRKLIVVRCRSGTRVSCLRSRNLAVAAPSIA
jgi:pimeloyl-ACP methyl ester carboxylesterase